MPWIAAERGPDDTPTHRPWRWWTALIAAVIVVALTIFVPIIGVAVYQFVQLGNENPTPEELRAAILNPGPLVIALLIGQILTTIAIAGLAGYGRLSWADALALRPPVLSWRIAAAIAGLVVLFLMFDEVLAFYYRDELTRDGEMVVSLLNSDIRVAAILLAVVGAPISEELLFRGFLYPAFARSRIGSIGAALVTTALWTGLHAYSIAGSIEIALFGLGLCWVLTKTKSLWPCIALHAALNAVFCALAILAAG